MNIITNILFSILLINFTVITGCFCIQCIEELRERQAKKQAKSNGKENSL